MTWEKRRGKRYLYRKRRQGKRVISEYIGRGETAALIARLEALKRQEREDTRRAQRQQRQAMAALDDLVQEAEELAHALTQAVLITHGYHTHKWVLGATYST